MNPLQKFKPLGHDFWEINIAQTKKEHWNLLFTFLKFIIYDRLSHVQNLHRSVFEMRCNM